MTFKSPFYSFTFLLLNLLLSGKTNNVVINGLRSALPLARARKPNNHIAQGSALGKHYTQHLHSPCKGKSLIIKVLPLQGALFIIYTIIPRALPYPLYTSLTILNISHLQKKLSSPVLKVVYPGRDWLL